MSDEGERRGTRRGSSEETTASPGTAAREHGSATPGERAWRDRQGTDWTLSHRPAEGSRDAGVVFRSVEYSFVATVPGREFAQLQDDDLHGYLDRAMGRREEGVDTARLWKDPRSRIEWEVAVDAGELVFRSGNEVVRTEWGDGRKAPHEMSDAELQSAIDEAESPRK